MKILAIPAFTQKTLINRMQKNPSVSVPNSLNVLNADTVSFKGVEDKDAVIDKFGLVKMNDNETDINNIFHITQKSNDAGKKIIDTFKWDSQFGEVSFFGDEISLAKHLKEKGKNITDFDVISADKHFEIGYTEDKFRYKLRYSKETHELIQAASVYIEKENDKNKTIERFILNPSLKNPGTFVAQYQFVKDHNGESAYDRTDIAFDKDMNVEQTETCRDFYFSDGEKEEADFVKVYDKINDSINTVQDGFFSRIY